MSGRGQGRPPRRGGGTNRSPMDNPQRRSARMLAAAVKSQGGSVDPSNQQQQPQQSGVQQARPQVSLPTSSQPDLRMPVPTGGSSIPMARTSHQGDQTQGRVQVAQVTPSRGDTTMGPAPRQSASIGHAPTRGSSMPMTVTSHQKGQTQGRIPAAPVTPSRGIMGPALGPTLRNPAPQSSLHTPPRGSVAMHASPDSEVQLVYAQPTPESTQRTPQRGVTMTVPETPATPVISKQLSGLSMNTSQVPMSPNSSGQSDRLRQSEIVRRHSSTSSANTAEPPVTGNAAAAHCSKFTRYVPSVTCCHIRKTPSNGSLIKRLLPNSTILSCKNLSLQSL